jgi:sigma-E factor negative regulatory protein RseC
VIREPATIVSVARGEVWVRCDAQQGCPRCAEGRGCGGGLLGGLLRDRLRLVRAVGDADGLAAGDRVVIGLAETSLVKAAATMYLVPLAGIVLGALLARGLAGTGDAVAMTGGVLGFLVALALVRRYGASRGSDPSFHPRILGRCEGRREDAPVALPAASGD